MYYYIKDILSNCVHNYQDVLDIFEIHVLISTPVPSPELRTEWKYNKCK